MCRVYRVPASQLLGVPRDPASAYLAFCIDRAVWYFGTSIEADMDEAEEELGPEAKAPARKDARLKVFRKYMDDPQTTTPPKGRYADPMAAIRAREATAGR